MNIFFELTAPKLRFLWFVFAKFAIHLVSSGSIAVMKISRNYYSILLEISDSGEDSFLRVRTGPITNMSMDGSEKKSFPKIAPSSIIHYLHRSFWGRIVCICIVVLSNHVLAVRRLGIFYLKIRACILLACKYGAILSL